MSTSRYTLTQLEGKIEEATISLKKAEEILEALRKNNFADLNDKDKQKAASVYSAIARRYRKNNDFVNSEKFHVIAMELFPDNNVIAKNAAIMLSKLDDDLAKLEKSESILAKSYESSKENYLFVTPYYRANVHIKMAQMCLNDKNKRNEEIALATEYLATANTALMKNLYYDDNYRSKCISKVALLTSYLEILLENHVEANASQQAAKEEREKIKEPQEKKTKFYLKFVNPNTKPYPGIFSRKRLREQNTASSSSTLSLTPSAST